MCPTRGIFKTHGHQTEDTLAETRLTTRQLTQTDKTSMRMEAARLHADGKSWRHMEEYFQEKYHCTIVQSTIRKWFAPGPSAKKTVKIAPAVGEAKTVAAIARTVDAKTPKSPPDTDPDEPLPPGYVSKDLAADLESLVSAQIGSTKRVDEMARRFQQAKDSQSELATRQIATVMAATTGKTAQTLTAAGVISFAVAESNALVREWAVALALGEMPMHPEWKLLPHQALILKTTAPYLMIHGGVGTRKSSACILKLLLHCHRHPGQRIIVAAKTYGQLEIVFFEEWKRLVPADLWTYNSQKARITLPGCDAVIWLAHEGRPDSWEKIHGSNLSGFYACQPETWTQRAFYDEIDQRVRLFHDGLPESEDVPDDPRYIRLFDCNAGSPDHFIHTLFIDQTSENYIGNKDPQFSEPIPGITIEADGDVTRIHIPTSAQNSAYTQRKIDQFRRTLPQSRFQRLVQGIWVAVTGRVYDAVTITETPIQPADISKFWIAFDPGTERSEENVNSGNLGIIVMAELAGGGYAVVDERLIGFKGLESFITVINSLADKWGRPKLQHMIKDWAGGAGVPLTDALRKAGYVVHAPASGKAKTRWFKVAAGIIAVYEAFKTGKLVVSKSCDKTQRDLRLYTYGDKPKGDGDPDKRIHDAHLLDALRYCWLRVGRHDKDD